MYSEIKQCMEEEKWERALGLMKRELEKENTSELMILAATIADHYGLQEDTYHFILAGLKLDSSEYELYFMLGNYYFNSNENQAFLCYENAAFLCHNEADKEQIRQAQEELCAQKAVQVAQISIVILSYNNLSYTQECIASIRKYCAPSAYEIIVVDNASDHETVEWLKEQEDLQVIYNTENVGFPKGCNQGIKAAKKENDIFLLNNDTQLTVNALYTLRMGLYSDAHVAMAGSITNMAANGQVISEEYDTMEDFYSYANRNNVPDENALEDKIWLVGFALLIRRHALNEVGMLDEQFSPGNYEDTDLGLRVMDAGYRNVLCHNSFIYHAGSKSFGRNPEKSKELYLINQAKMRLKWGFEISYYEHARNEIIGMINRNKDESFEVLELGCGIGATLHRIQYTYPNVRVHGIELQKDIARLGGKVCDIVQGDVEEMNLTDSGRKYDYIILGDILEHLREPALLLKRLRQILNKDGAVITSIPNVMHASVIVPLLQGRWDYSEAGILAATHLRFFTKDSIIKMFTECDYQIEEMSGIISKAEELHTKEDNWFKRLTTEDATADPIEFEIYQYIVLAR